MNSLWTLLQSLLFDAQGQVRDLYGVLGETNARLTSLLEPLNLPAWTPWAAGIVLAVIVGLFGYRLIKLVMGLTLAGVGYMVGCALFDYVNGLVVTELPAWLVYVFGGVIAALFLVLAVTKFSYAMYVGIGIVGFSLTLFYTGNHTLALGGAFLLATLSVFAVRFFFILLTSAVGGIFTVNFVSLLLPNIAFLKLGAEEKGIFVALGVAALMLLIQYISTHKLAKAERERRKARNARRRRRRRAAR